jgi:hypothetical protein
VTERRALLDVSHLSDAIQLAPGKDAKAGPRVRYSLILLVFMRAIACLWILRGLLAWEAVLRPPGALDLAAAPPSGATVFFCVANIVAGVGMWMGTSWGGILWLFAASAGMVATLLAPDAGLVRHAGFLADVTLVVCYFTLSWYAARERDE